MVKFKNVQRYGGANIMNKAERNGKIDFYKFIMSLIVIIYHFGNAVDYDGVWFR